MISLARSVFLYDPIPRDRLDVVINSPGAATSVGQFSMYAFDLERVASNVTMENGL